MTGPGGPPARAPTRPPRVVFVDESWTFGGAITSLAHLARGLVDRGVEVTVVSGQDPALLSGLFPTSRCISVPIRHPSVQGDPFLDGPVSRAAVRELGPVKRLARSAYWFGNRDLAPAVEIAGIARRVGADVVHLNNGWQLDGALAARVLGVGCVAHLRGFWEPPPDPAGAPVPVRWARRAMRGLLYGLVPPHATLTVSGAVAEGLRAHPIPSRRIAVVHDGVDVDAFAPGAPPGGLRAELGIPDDAVVVGHFGRVIPWKGTREFVEGLARAAPDTPSLHGLVVGDASDGPAGYEREVRETARRLGVASRVTFTGYRDDVPALMRACHVVVHTSTRPEPFGMVVAEGMATGRPVIAADAGGPLEIVREGVDGYLVDPADAGALARRIRELATRPDLRDRMGAAARRRARRLFSKERYADEVMQIYRRVLEGDLRR